MNFRNNFNNTGGAPAVPLSSGNQTSERFYAVSSATQRLQRATERLHGALGDLEGRLHPILAPRQDMDKAQASGVGPACGVPMADVIDNQAEIVERAESIVAELFNRVEL